MHGARPRRSEPVSLQNGIARAWWRRAAGSGQHAAAWMSPTRRMLASIDAGEILAGLGGVAVAVLTLDMADAVFVAIWWLLVLIVVRSDIAEFIIPDQASLAIAGLGLLHTAIAATAGPYTSLTTLLLALAVATGTGLGAAVLLWAIGRTFLLVRGHDGLGFGDVKLAGASAIWLGPSDACLALQLAVVAALGTALLDRRIAAPNSDGALPFGAFLAPAAWLVYLARLLAPDLIGALWP